jgi:hypothetical protein
MAEAERKYVMLAAVVTAVVSVTSLGLVVIAESVGFGEKYEPFWAWCREINYPLAVVAAIGVFYRLVLMAFDRDRYYTERGIHLLLWFTYIAIALVLVAVGSQHYSEVDAPATWVSGARTLLNIGAIVLTVWWPHPRPYEDMR